jgi:hypothetical protein
MPTAMDWAEMLTVPDGVGICASFAKAGGIERRLAMSILVIMGVQCFIE